MNIISISKLCAGCLSDSRDLRVLNGEMIQTVTAMFQLSYNVPPWMCFECEATLQRATRFKKQVKFAHTYLLNHSISVKCKSLSKLSVRNTLVIDNVSPIPECDDTKHCIVSLNHDIEYINDDLSDINTKKCKKKKNNNKKTVKKYKKEVKIDEKSVNTDEKSLESYQNIKEETEPLAFIKVEEFNDIDMKDDHFNDIDSKSIILDGVFVDSDDEPLGSKTNIHTYIQQLDTDSKLKKGRKRSGERSGVVSDPRVTRKLHDLGIEPGRVALVMLTWEQVEEERQKARVSSPYVRLALRCAQCVVGFNHSHKLAEHMRKHSPEAGGEVCAVCAVRCRTRAALAAHTRRHRARWVCLACGARYSLASVAGDHAARAHDAAPPAHRCRLCAHVARSRGALRRHAATHAARAVCETCRRSFRDAASLRTHMYVHRGVKEHACGVCDKTFTFKKQREIHEQTHRPSLHLYCHQCDVSFKSQSSYYQHMKYNLKHIDPTDIKHACGTCGARFVRASRLREHELAVHLKLAPLACAHAHCAFRCASRARLRSHRRAAHAAAPPPRAHVCHRCGHTYKTKKSLESHLRTHSSTLEQKTPAESACVK